MIMLLIAFLGGASIFLLGIGLFSGGGVSDENVARRLGEIQDDPKGRKFQNNIDFKKLFSALFSPIKKKAEKATEKNGKASQKQRKVNAKTEAFEKMLRYAGINMTAGQFNYIRYGVAFGFGLLGAIIAFALNLDGQNKLLATVFCLILGAYIPTKLLSSKVANKKSAIQRELPDIMDLLVVSVEAGLGFDSALIRLWEKNKGPVMQELMQTIRD
ncbi:MAG: hypothetical protein MJ067_03190, partial [Oscillospiraceae bacterium]|nr:hypothetical protein [Oscillospiraceae bacterium]